MATYIVVSIVGGILFAILDGLINANPVAQHLYAVYKPIAKTSLNIVAGVAIDLAYGFILGTVFLLLYTSLSGEIGITKGLSFAILVWLFRVVMSVASRGFCLLCLPGRCYTPSLLDWQKCLPWAYSMVLLCGL